MFMDKNILYMYIVWDGYLYLCIICMVLKYLKKIMFLLCYFDDIKCK